MECNNLRKTIDHLNLIPAIPWHKKIIDQWPIGEQGAQKKLQTFLRKGLENYQDGRDYPSLSSTSKLSPYLHFGEISPNQAWHAVRSHGENENVEHFCRELGWREFSYHLLYHNKDLPKKNLQKKFNFFPWRFDENDLNKWQKGKTGIPIVDAGMRELWQTGYMHNRVRMIVGSFLVKNLRIHWHYGERWFWDCLVDADLANNSASWQWIAGCGADPVPYFRIFNPVTQGKKFDPKGLYTRQYVPELKKITNEYLFNPWEAPHNILKSAGVDLGSNYPNPIVDLKKSRKDALTAFQSLKETSR
jgi:deoxyribodipyrimidine photo-lyase